LVEGREPEPGAYFPQGRRQLVVKEQNGATRAVTMLLGRLQGDEVFTELPLPTFEKVPPAPALEDLTGATIVLGTEGGVVPVDNPDRIEMSMATKWGRYSLQGMAVMSPKRFTANHGGYDNTVAKDDPNRVVPLDVMREMAAEGKIGNLVEFFYTTAGNATTVDNATRFGREIAQDIRAQFADKVGVVFTST
jgi:betaine reductase